MSNSKATYEELLIENKKLRQLISEKTDNAISLINSTKNIHNEDALKYLKLEAAFENMVQAFFITDLEGNLINFNTAFSEFHRFKNKDECVKNINNFFELFIVFLPSGEVLTLEEWPVVRALRGDTVNYAEYLLKRIDTGESWPCTYSFAPILDEKGNITGSVVSCEDITERKKIKENQKEIEEKFRLFSQISPVGLFVTDIEGKTIYWNKKLDEITGMLIEEGKGSGWVDSIHPDDKDMVFKEWYKSTESRSNFNLEYRFLNKKGKTTWVIAQAVPMNDLHNNLIGFVGNITDISRIKLAENELKWSEDRFRSIVQQSPLSTQIFTPDGLTAQVNQSYEDLWGITLEDLKDYNILEDQQLVSLGIMPYIQRAFSGEATSIPIAEYDTMKSLGKGNKSWILARIYPVKNIAGNIDKIILIHEDITKQKTIEQELIKAKEKAEESDRLKSAFLANMSHEIRTPMNGILGFIDLLNQPNLTKEKIDTYSKVINKSGNRLLDTINDIIDISKVESGEMDTIISKIYLNNELDELFSFHAPEAISNGLSLLIEPSLLTEEVAVLTDGHKLHGILTNLIKNAIKYTEKGSITFGYSLKNNFIEFFVKDTGIGIPINRLHAIFNRFEQVDIEDKKVFQGSGLGLAISKAYTEMLGGKIFVESEEGKGSIFKFTIPFNKVKNQSIIKTVETINNNISKFGELKLLIADDDDTSSKLLEIMLEGIFQKIIFAKNGIEAIKLCKNSSEVDIVLMDIKMPEMNGYNATREIRKFTKDLIIIAQTAYALSGDKEKMLEVGCNDYISKPINKELLLEIIGKNISKKCI